MPKDPVPVHPTGVVDLPRARYDSRPVNEVEVLRVAHLVDAMGGSDRLWGKERVVALLMREHAFDRAVSALGRVLDPYPIDVVHSHGYLANIIARALRVMFRLRGAEHP